ncbi:MAG TPA: class I SAM-dependent methyltransferase, partial [Acidimicrobiales bacterium]|nr:class I SAM-dependent methyltransferase [Acidimicrobiales bacterium]
DGLLEQDGAAYLTWRRPDGAHEGELAPSPGGGERDGGGDDEERDEDAERGVEARFLVLDALRLDVLGETFDTALDSGLLHVFDDASRARYVSSLQRVLVPGGHLYLMCFSDRQPGDWGPRRVTEGELRGAFSAGWRIESLLPDHFDINPGHDTLVVEAWLADVVRL